MLTDNEIINALECCISFTNLNECDNCPFHERCENGEELESLVLSLINRQKAEIERLKVDSKMHIVYKGARGFGRAFFFSEVVKQAKAEAIKEFVERLKREKRDLFCIENIDGLIDNLVKEMVGEDKW